MAWLVFTLHRLSHPFVMFRVLAICQAKLGQGNRAAVQAMRVGSCFRTERCFIMTE